MARPRKDGKRFSMILDSELANRLKKFSDESGMPKTTIIEKALRLYLADKEEVIKKLNK